MKSLYPFCLFKPSDTPNFYVAFKNNLTGEYLPSISTRKSDRAEALKTALDWYYNGIPKKRNSLSIAQYSLMDLAKKADLTGQEAKFIIKELQRHGFLKSYVLADSKQDTSFTEFLLSFWDYEKSPYIQEKLRKNHGIHKRYCEEQLGMVKARTARTDLLPIGASQTVVCLFLMYYYPVVAKNNGCRPILICPFTGCIYF